MDHVKEIGDALTELDRCIAQVNYRKATTGDTTQRLALAARQLELEQKRDALDEKQRLLVKTILDQATPAYKQMVSAVGQLNKDLTAAHKDMEDVTHALAAAGRAIGVVDRIINTVAGLL